MDLAGLPPREAQVLELISEGLTTPQIADRIGTSESTVRNQITTLYLRIGVDNRVAAGRWFREQQKGAAA